jgi:stage II sporulation protein D
MLQQRMWLYWCLLMSTVCLTVVLFGLLLDKPSDKSNVHSHRQPQTESQPQPTATAGTGQVIVRKAPPALTVRVFLSATKKIQRIPLEQYVLGVVAAEMPDQFADEALKAQALAARTYIVHKMVAAQKEHPGKPFIIGDTVDDQSYIDRAAMERKWALAKDPEGLRKLRKAVHQTAGLIITYEHEPIDATYFSTSNGYTENSADYWGLEVPYLQSVQSPWDPPLSDRYKTTVRMTFAQFLQKLGILSNNPRAAIRSMTVLEKTDGKRIKSLRIGKHEFSGRELREKLGLRSSHFLWTLERNQIVITTFGNGHGVGLSQWGAHGMALNGYDAEAIIKHYYNGVDIELMTPTIKKTVR